MKTASSMLWVTMRMAWVGMLPPVHSSSNSPRSDSALNTSNAENGSSRHSKSGSMKGAKFVLAQTAAQAVALAVREANGEVVGILFDDSAQVADTGDGALLFCEPDGLSYGGTAFEFLADAWRRWPAHVILLVTDGDGSIPLALPGDKARTSAILIPSDCDLGAMSQIAARVVTLGDLRGLADVLALLTPRIS